MVSPSLSLGRLLVGFRRGALRIGLPPGRQRLRREAARVLPEHVGVGLREVFRVRALLVF